MKMNEVIKEIARRTSTSQKDASSVLHSFKDIILDSIKKKERISWNGFFTLNYYVRKVSYRNDEGRLVKYDKPKAKISLCRAYRDIK